MPRAVTMRPFCRLHAPTGSLAEAFRRGASHVSCTRYGLRPASPAQRGTMGRRARNERSIEVHRSLIFPPQLVHTEARDGFGGSNASFYERARPGYPAAAVRAIETEILGSPCLDKKQPTERNGKIVDLGCGTGKFTREILPFARAHQFSLIGVEPVAAMRQQFEAALPGVLVVEGIGERIPVPSTSAVAVVAAQSFHWMSSTATLREVHRILLPGGLFVLLWNTRDASKPWIRALDDIIDPFYGDDVPRQQGGSWRQAFQDLEREHNGGPKKETRTPTRFFGELTEQHFINSQLHTPEELEHRLRSVSVIATRPEPERLDAMRRARELAETHPDTREDVRRHGKVELFYDTEVYWCRKVDS